MVFWLGYIRMTGIGGVLRLGHVVPSWIPSALKSIQISVHRSTNVSICGMKITKVIAFRVAIDTQSHLYSLSRRRKNRTQLQEFEFPEAFRTEFESSCTQIDLLRTTIV